MTRAGYYAWRARPVSAHAVQDRQLTQRLQQLFHQHHGRYGSPRLCRTLRAEGWRVSQRRVARLMREAGLQARVVRVYRANPRLHRFFDRHPNRLPAGGARRPDQVWVGDVTYLPVGRRTWWFLAAVVDQCSRRVVAWAFAGRRDSHLTLRALEAAVRRRHPAPGLIFHSDRGSEYCALALRDRLVARGYRQSAARRGPEDNAHMESFFHSLKAELVHGTHFTTPEALRRAIAQYVRYYNFQRAHSALDYRTPVDYEAAVA